MASVMMSRGFIVSLRRGFNFCGREVLWLLLPEGGRDGLHGYATR